MKMASETLMDGIKALPAFPVVFVTVDDNIMVAAAFHFYSYNPPAVMVGIKPEKHTYKLIKEQLEFGISIPNVDQLEAVKVCGSRSGRDTDKFEMANLTRQEAETISTVLIGDCPVNIECRVVHEIAYDGSHRWFIGEIKKVHLDPTYKRSQALMFWLGQFRSLGPVIEGLKDEDLFKD